MSSYPSISVVIPTYKGIETLGRTLRNLYDQRYPAHRVEVLLAAHESDPVWADLASLVAESGSRARIVRSPSRLPAVKRNTAIREAIGDLLLILNDDVWLEADALAEHARLHSAHKGELVAVLGHIDQSSEMTWTPFIEWYTPFAYFQIADRADQPVPYQFFWTMHISVPRTELIRRGLFLHEQWAEIGNEDIELGWRWAKAGGTILYGARARGQHFHPHTLETACLLQESIGRGLADLERLVDDPLLLERYGVFSWRNTPRAIVRGLIRQVLFNALTVGHVQRWLGRRTRNSALTRWLYWKVMLHYTNRGYRNAGARRTLWRSVAGRLSR